MAKGFVDLMNIVPPMPAKEPVFGRLTVQDVLENRVVRDPAVMNSIGLGLIQTGLALIVGPKNRGKTFLAKTFGLEFVKEHEHARAFYGSISAIDFGETIAEIREANGFVDRSLYIVEDCHLRTDTTLILIEALLNIKLISARVLLTSRDISPNVPWDEAGLVAGLEERGAVVYLRPQKEFVRRLVRAGIASLKENEVERAVEALVPRDAGSVDLRTVVEVVKRARAGDQRIEEIAEREVLRTVVEGRLSDPEVREVVLRIAAIAQFDVAVEAGFVDSPQRNAVVAGLLKDGLLRMSGITEVPGLYYSLDEESDADLYLRAAVAHNLLGGRSEETYVLERSKEYLISSPLNPVPVLSGAMAQYGIGFIAKLVADPAIREVCAKIGERSSVGTAAALLSILRRADEDASREVLERLRTAVGDAEVVKRIENASVREMHSFLSIAGRLSEAPTRWMAEIHAEAIKARMLEAEGPELVKLLELFSRVAPELRRRIGATGVLSAELIARALESARLQRVLWALRDLDRDSAAGLLGDVLRELGGAKWFLNSMKGESLAVVGSVLTLLRDVEHRLYQEVIGRLDYEGLAATARGEGANGLHQYLPSVPLPHREKVLRLLSEEDWRTIAAQSSLASIANLLEDLIRHPLGHIGPAIAGGFARSDLKGKLRAGRIGLFGRLMRNVGKLAPGSEGLVCSQIAELSPEELEVATMQEPEMLRLERVGKLMAQVRKAERSAARKVIGGISVMPLGQLARTSSTKALQRAIYNMLVIDREIAQRWVGGAAIQDLVPMEVTRSAVDDIFWLIWNVIRIDAVVAMAILGQLIQSRDLSAHLDQASVAVRLGFLGLSDLLGCELGLEMSVGPREIAGAVNAAGSPGLRCVAAYGVYVWRAGRLRPSIRDFDKASLSNDVRQLEQFPFGDRWGRMQEVLQSVIDAVDASDNPIGSM